MVALRKIAALAGKDLRHVWPQLLVMLPLMALFTTHDLEPLTRHKPVLVATVWQLLFLATPLTLWSVLATIVHGEPLTGDCQYWLTRPFTWYHLAAAKVVAIVLCINLPLFLCQAVAFAGNGISPVAYLADLFWRQAFFAAFILLPAFVLAAVTRTHGQFALAAILLAAPFAGLAWFSPFAGLGWPYWNGQDVEGAQWMAASALAAMLFAGSCGILLLQYKLRRTALARTLFAITVLLCVPLFAVPWEKATGPFVSQANIRISLDRTLRYHGDDWRYRYRQNSSVELPLRVEGLPPGSELALNYSRVTVENQAMGWVRLHGWDGNTGFLQLAFGASEWPKVSDRNVTVKGRIYLTVMMRGEALATSPDTLRIPGFGVCTRSQKVCLSPQPHAALSLIPTILEQRPDQYGRIVPLADSYAPFPTSPLFYPLQAYHYEPDYGVLLVERPAGHFLYNFEFQNVHLADFARPY
jgi:hypothetical protein